jgi:hypothetical protein
LNPNRHPPLLARLPLRHGFDNPNSFFVAASTNTAKNLDLVDAASLVHDKGDDHNTL